MNGSSARSASETLEEDARRWPAGSATQRSSVATTRQERRSAGTGSQAIATSTSEPPSPTVASCQATCRNSSFHPGSSSAILAVTAGMRPRPIRVWKPTVNVAERAASVTARWVSSHCASTSRACGSIASPAFVSLTVRRSRSNSRTRSDDSSCRICLLSAGWEMKSRSVAALVKLSSSATATK